FVMGSGAGGQKVNKTSSCVYLQHVPTGIHVKYHRERSREINRYMARVTLCTKIEERIKKRCRDRRMAAEKVRRQKRGRSRNSKNRMLEDKHRHSQKKTMRRPPQRED
ncbi:MAG: peptide chain release factor-like protein, partial [Waddliaceae bacterium]|nr:peptide chain release factor-like protein [Waddliaceae bacterium]